MLPFKTALNVSTLFPFDLNVKQQVRIAAEAGYEGIELWVKDIEAYLQNGGTLRDLKRYIADTGLPIVNAIAFFRWADADPPTRQHGFEQAAREMRILAELGCVAVAAPPFGDVESVSLSAMAGHFAALAELARGIGIEPYLEFWGRAKTLSRLSEAAFVAIESGVPNARLLLDPFHMYTGGSDIHGLTLLSGDAIGIVHVNDYPAALPREQIADSDRVLPGAGIAPTREFAELLHHAGYRGYLSLELFVENYAEQSALEVARQGIEAVQRAYSVAD